MVSYLYLIHPLMPMLMLIVYYLYYSCLCLSSYSEEDNDRTAVVVVACLGNNSVEVEAYGDECGRGHDRGDKDRKTVGLGRLLLLDGILILILPLDLDLMEHWKVVQLQIQLQS